MNKWPLAYRATLVALEARKQAEITATAMDAAHQRKRLLAVTKRGLAELRSLSTDIRVEATRMKEHQPSQRTSSFLNWLVLRCEQAHQGVLREYGDGESL